MLLHHVIDLHPTKQQIMIIDRHRLEQYVPVSASHFGGLGEAASEWEQKLVVPSRPSFPTGGFLVEP